MYQDYEFNNFKSGTITRLPNNRIPDDAFSDAQNIRLNSKFMPTRDAGQQKYNSTTIGANPIRGGFLYAKSDGTKYYIVACGGKLYYSVTGSGTWTAYQIDGSDLGIDSDADVEFVQYNDYVYVVNGKYPIITGGGATYTTSRMIKINGTTPSELTGADIPKGLKYIFIHQERMVGLNSTDAANGMYWTEPYDMEDWTPDYGLNYDYIGKDDGENISGGASYQGFIFVFKPRNIYRYSTQGDITQWASSRVDTNYGALYHRTIQLFQGYLVYLSPGGVARLDGNNATLVDEPIRDTILALPQMQQNERSWSKSTTAEWDAGTLGTKLLTSASDELKQFPQSVAADWNAGALTQAVVSGDTVILDKPATEVTNRALSGSASASGYSTTYYPSNAIDGNLSTSWALYWDPQITWLKVDLGSSVRIRKFTGRITSYYSYLNPAPIVSSAPNLFYLQGSNDDSSWTTIKTITPSSTASLDYDETIDVTYRYFRLYFNYNASYYKTSARVNEFRLFGDFYTTGNISTQILDFGFTPVSMGKIATQETKPSGTGITYQTRTSADGTSWDAWTNVGSAGENGGAINSTARRYLQWKALFTSNAAQTETPILHQGYVGASWLSEVKDLGSVPSSYGKLEVSSTENSQTITYWMRSGASEAACEAASWHEQTAGTYITGPSTLRYIQIKVHFSTDLYSQVPVLESFRVVYYTAPNLVSPCAAVWKDNYWLNVAEVGETTNNAVWRYNKEGFWLKRTNKNNNVYFIDSDKLLSGTSASDGFVRYNDIGTTDDGAEIVSYFVTKNLGLATSNNIFRRLYILSVSDNGFTVSYSINGGAYTDITINSASVATIERKIFEGIARGQTIMFKVTSSTADENFEFHSLKFEWQPQGRLPIG